MLSPVVEKVVFQSYLALDMAPIWAVPGLFTVLCTSDAPFECFCMGKDIHSVQSQNNQLLSIFWRNAKFLFEEKQKRREKAEF